MKSKLLLSVIFVATFALSRIPGLLPPNFSAAYAFAFCAGVFFSGALAWFLPLGVMLVTDVSLNLFYYHEPPFTTYLLLNCVIYALLISLGKLFGRKASLFRLVLGGLTGAVIFYVVTNTLSWLQDAAYAKTVAGWIQALTLGRPDWHPTTWEMFRNTLLSGGLFTALFATTEKLTAESPAEKTAGAREPATETESEPEEAKA
jgi:Ni/Fe-hydrogenase subunit HybB-like protein